MKPEFWDSLEILDKQHWVAQSFRGRGDLEFSGSLRFNGQWRGTINSLDEDGHLYVMREAQIFGRLKVARLSVEGSLLDVDIEAQSFRALKGSRIVGKVRAEKIIIEEGAIIEGRLICTKNSGSVQF